MVMVVMAAVLATVVQTMVVGVVSGRGKRAPPRRPRYSPGAIPRAVRSRRMQLLRRKKLPVPRAFGSCLWARTRLIIVRIGWRGAEGCTRTRPPDLVSCARARHRRTIIEATQTGETIDAAGP